MNKKIYGQILEKLFVILLNNRLYVVVISLNNTKTYKLIEGRVHCEIFLSEYFMKY